MLIVLSTLSPTKWRCTLCILGNFQTIPQLIISRLPRQGIKHLLGKKKKLILFYFGKGSWKYQIQVSNDQPCAHDTRENLTSLQAISFLLIDRFIYSGGNILSGFALHTHFGNWLPYAGTGHEVLIPSDGYLILNWLNLGMHASIAGCYCTPLVVLTHTSIVCRTNFTFSQSLCISYKCSVMYYSRDKLINCFSNNEVITLKNKAQSAV